MIHELVILMAESGEPWSPRNGRKALDGTLTAGQDILFMATNVSYPVDEVGVFRPSFTPVERLGPGEVGYVAASIKTLAEAHVGDTITDAQNPKSWK